MKQAGSDSFFERMERRRKNRLRPQSTTVSDATADLLDLEEAILPRTHHQERQQREPFDPPRGVVPPLPIIVGSSFAHTAAVSSSAGAMLPPPPPRGSMSNTMQWLNGPVKWTMTDDWHEFDPTQAFSCLSAERTQPAMATMPRSSPPEVGGEASGSRAKPEKSKDQTSCHEGMGTTFAAPAEKGQDGGKTSTNPTATAACEPTSTTTTAGGSPEPLRSIPFNAALEETQGKDDGNPEDASRRSPQPNRQEEKGEVGGATSCHHHLLGEETARKRPRSEEGDASSVPSLPEDRPATHNLNRCPFLWNITTTALEPSSSALPSGGLVATPEGGNPFSPGAMRVSGPQFLNSNSSSNIFAFVPGELLLFHRSPNQPRPSNNSELWKEVPRTSMSPSSHRKRDSAGIHSDDDAAASADDEGLWRTLYWDDYTMRKGGGAMMMSPVKELAECVGQLVARRRAGMAVPATEQQSSSSSLESSSVPPPPSEDQEGA